MNMASDIYELRKSLYRRRFQKYFKHIWIESYIYDCFNQSFGFMTPGPRGLIKEEVEQNG
jgi:hypothetical protein